MVMDDAYTYFDAEHKNKTASSSLSDQDGLVYEIESALLGTFPERSAFRVVLKKSGRQLTSVRCDGVIKTKAKDEKLRSNPMRKYSLNYDDYMSTDLHCFKEDVVTKETGQMDVDVLFINGDTDEEKLVRTYKIDVHRATNVRGNASRPEQDVPSYYIQRHAESAVAFAYFDYTLRSGGYNGDPVDRGYGERDVRTLRLYTSYSPQAGKYMPNSMFARCAVNGQPIDLSDNRNRDNVKSYSSGRVDEVGTYTDRLAAKYKTGGPYVDKVLFKGLVFELPIYTGGTPPASDT